VSFVFTMAIGMEWHVHAFELTICEVVSTHRYATFTTAYATMTTKHPRMIARGMFLPGSLICSHSNPIR